MSVESNNVHTIIIGAGLSGLTTAYQFKKAGFEDFTILEARDRTGGRIWTKEGLDLGGTWFQEHHESFINFLDELGIGKFRQYTTGKSAFMYSSMAPFQYFENDPDTAAFRINGGSSHLINELASRVNAHLNLENPVLKLENHNDQIIISTPHSQFRAQQVIVAIPPQVFLRCICMPDLPDYVVDTIKETHTWMSNAIKIGLQFKYPFWRDKGLSGTIIGHVAPVIELYDHVSNNRELHYLMGFVNEGLRYLNDADRKERILTYLEKHFGTEIRKYEHYAEYDWSKDPWTANDGLNSVYISPSYGHPVFDQAHMGGRLWFSGAETASVHGGYMDGAVQRGKWVSEEILKSAGNI